MILRSIYPVIFVLLMPQVQISQTRTPPPVKIGYSCYHFYELELGTPVFMQGEEIWLKAERDLTVALYWSGQEIASRNMLAHSSTRLHVFRAEDPPGLWQLKVHSGEDNFLVPLYLVRAQAEASLTYITFNLTGTQLSIGGSVTIEDQHEGGILLLKGKDQVTSLEMSPVPYREGMLRAQISWDRANPGSLSVMPYSPQLVSPNATTIWAEVSSEIPLMKQVGATQVFTLLPQTVLRTNRVAMNIQSWPQQAFKIEFPDLHQVGLNGQVPLRLGPIRLTVYVQIEKAIYVLLSDAFLLANGFVSSSSTIEIPPLLNSVAFQLTDDLQQLSDYSLILIAKEAGVNVIWNKTVVPPVTRMRVVNTLTNELVDDYDITSDQIREIAKVGSQTFAIPHNPKLNAELKLSIGGVPLQPDEFAPRSIELKPLSTVDIRTSASTVHLRVTDALGSMPSSAAVRLTRTRENKIEAFQRTLKAVNGTMNLTLPLGNFDIEMAIEGSTITRQFSVRLPSEFIDLKLNELVLAESRTELVLMGAGCLIVIIEALVAVRLWKSLRARQRKATS